MVMRTGIFLSYAGGFLEAVDEVVELEKLGVDLALVAEAYSYDAISQLGFLAARTSRIELGTGVVPIYTRTPALMAMTAAGLDYVSDGRFRLGLGTSGPQVIEGFHGLPFDAPLGRTREVVDICRQVCRENEVDIFVKKVKGIEIDNKESMAFGELRRDRPTGRWVCWQVTVERQLRYLYVEFKCEVQVILVRVTA